jgi:hypothetical protein
VIDHAFNKFVRDDGNSVEAALLKGAYCAKIHPKVLSSEISEDEAFLELLKNFNDKDGNGRVHRDDWNAYFSGVSAKVENDQHFTQLMCQAWKL